MPAILKKASLITMFLACMTALLYEVHALGFGYTQYYFGAYTCLLLAQGVILAMFGLTPELFANPIPKMTFRSCMTLSIMLLVVACLPAYFGHVLYAPSG